MGLREALSNWWTVALAFALAAACKPPLIENPANETSAPSTTRIRQHGMPHVATSDMTVSTTADMEVAATADMTVATTADMGVIATPDLTMAGAPDLTN